MGEVGAQQMKRKPEKFLLRLPKGALVPVDSYTADRLRAKGYAMDDILSAVLTKPRNPKFHALAHAIGRLVAENIEDFSGMDAHAVLKRLQWEAGVGCHEMGVKMPGVGYTMVRIPDSLSFASMDEGTFREVVRGLCRHIAENYWPGLTPEQVEEMAGVMVEE